MPTLAGRFPVDDHQIIRVPGGIMPFVDEEYILLTGPEAEPFARLQSLGQPGVGFIVVVPEVVYGPGVLELGENERRLVGLEPEEQPLILALMALGESLEQHTVNLLAPLVINPRTNRGQQIILAGDLDLLNVPLPVLLKAA
jgi:flagellar assembly factor FliW